MGLRHLPLNIAAVLLRWDKGWAVLWARWSRDTVSSLNFIYVPGTGIPAHAGTFISSRPSARHYTSTVLYTTIGYKITNLFITIV